MTNYLVHKTYTQATHALSQTSENIFLFEEDKQTNFIFPAARKVEIKNRAHKLLDRGEISAPAHRSIIFCACRKNIRWLANWSLMARRLKFTFDFPAVNESLWLGRRLCLWLHERLFISSLARAFRYILLFLSHLLFYMQTVLYALKIETCDIFKGTEKCMWNKTSSALWKGLFSFAAARIRTIGVDYLFAAIWKPLCILG